MALKRILPSRVPQAGGAAASPQPASASADFEAPMPTTPTAAAQPPAAPQSAPGPAPQPKVDTSAALAAALAELSAQSAPLPAAPVVPPQPQAADEPAPQFDADEPSLPDANGMRRRVRDKKPRAFVSSPAPVAAGAPVAKATADYTESVTNQLDDRLASMGVGNKAEEDRLPQSGAMAEVPSTTDYLTAPASPISLEQEMEPVAATPMAPPAPQPQAAAPAPEPEFEAPAAPLAPLSTSQADIPPVESDLPWAKPSEPSNDWEFDTPVAPQTTQPSAPATPPQDIFRGVADASVQQESSGGVVPPWQLSRNPSLPPPELPLPRKPSFTTSGNGSSTQVVIAGAVVALILFGAYKLVQSDKQQEQVARWTGSLQETTEKLPPELGGVQPQPDANLIKPEQVIAMQNGVSGSTLLPPPADVGQNTMVNVFDTQPSSSSAVIDFADVPPDQSGKPIVADGSEKMPEDIGFIASLQKAIAAEKAKQGIAPDGTATATDSTKPETVLSQAEKLERGEEMKAKLEEELAAYRRALAGADNPALAPKPTEFFSGEQKPADPSLLPPPAKGIESVAAATGKANGLPPAELYTNNPGNLPVIPEPTAEEEVKIRELKDFDVELFEPEREKVRVPKGIKPRFATTDFPDLEVLSFVPGRGVIAYANGREGVLLVGESMEGWQLTRVFADRAEFKNGSRNHYLTAE